MTLRPILDESHISVNLSQLESHLWEAANILRSNVNAADYKTYIFTPPFFKRLSDVHDEEGAAALAESDSEEEYALLPRNYRFQIPEGCPWRDVRVVTANVAEFRKPQQPAKSTESAAAGAA